MSTRLEHSQISDWRLQMALAELDQAIEFDRGLRDDTFRMGLDSDTLKLMRAGAILGCVRNAINYLRPRTVQGMWDRHVAGVCVAELCPWCTPEDWD